MSVGGPEQPADDRASRVADVSRPPAEQAPPRSAGQSSPTPNRAPHSSISSLSPRTGSPTPPADRAPEMTAAAPGAEGEIVLSLTVREARALWRFASMFHAGVSDALGGTPCEIDMALGKVELGLLMAGERPE